MEGLTGTCPVPLCGMRRVKGHNIKDTTLPGSSGLWPGSFTITLFFLKGAEVMDDLVKILNSFHPGWKERKYVDRFITILKEMVIPAYSLLHARIENNRAVFPEEWSRIVSASKEAHF